MARTPRKWQGARTPSGLKRVRQAERRRAILQPRRSAAKTLVAKSLTTATADPTSADVATFLSDAISALDRAAKAGAIHPNAAARRKSRLARKVNAAVGGSTVVTAGHVAKSTGKAAAVKAAKARIAAGKAVKAKGAQTAAGKARAALSKSTRADTTHAAATAETVAATAGHQGSREGAGQGRGQAGRQGDDQDDGREVDDRQGDDGEGRGTEGDRHEVDDQGGTEDDEGQEGRVVASRATPDAPVIGRGVSNSGEPCLRRVGRAWWRPGPRVAPRACGGSRVRTSARRRARRRR